MPSNLSALPVDELASELVRVPSVNPMGREIDPGMCHEGRMADAVEEFFRELGLPTERFEVAPGRPNILARVDMDAAAPTIILDAHLDTVPVDGMTVPPFEGLQRDGRLFGRGAADVKGPLAAMLVAIRRLAEARPGGAANVVFSGCCDEESTTLGIRHLIRTWQSGRSYLLPRAPDFAIIAEPTSLSVVAAHKGVVRVKVRTAGRACHSSAPEQGINAIYRMARVVTSIEDYATLLREHAEHPLCGRPSISVGRVTGGTSVNVVPDSCCIEIDRRLIPGETIESARTSLEGFLQERAGDGLQMDPPWLTCPPLCDGPNDVLAEAVIDRLSVIGIPCQKIGVPFGTHAAYTAQAGVPSVVLGPGSISQAHTSDEWIDLDQLDHAANVYYEICRRPPDESFIPPSRRSPA
jgi:succinyl-diaminopimelate desuccinylase